MSDEISKRKTEHLEIIREDPDVDRRKMYFRDIRLIHRALPELSLGEIDPSVEIMGKRLAFPLVISSMTGGSDDLARQINRNLAVAAETCGVAMGVGSQRVMFSSESARRSFDVREFAPGALLFANLGAVQLNYGFGIEQCREAVDVLDADALYLHLNPLQEAIQAEGDCNFSDLAEKIGTVAKELNRPVILKEVGCGMSPADVATAYGHGIRYFDVAGSGGTSWSRIEEQRNVRRGQGNDLGFAFQDWGMPTPLALQALKPWQEKVTLIASGGIRSGVDMVKALVLGARLCGLASPFLEPARESAAAARKAIEQLKREFVMAMFLLGAKTIDDLVGNESLIL